MKSKATIGIIAVLSLLLLSHGCGTSSEKTEISNNDKPQASVSSIEESSEAENTTYESAELAETEIATEISETVTTKVSSETISVTTTTAVTAVLPPETYGEMKVHFIDVGQGDSIFIELPNEETMLIDAGEIGEGDKVVTYIYSQGYDTIDYLVASHAHSDHIGGMPDVLDSFNIENFYMTSAAATTNIYEEMLNGVEISGADVHYVMAGDVIFSCDDLCAEVVAPKEIADDDHNNNSVVVKLTYGENKFLFTGDAEKSEEDGIWTNIKCDVLKVGHHGSDTSSSANFIKKVEPTYAVISCGLGNSYGHPTDEVMERLTDKGIEIFRTDMQGTIVFTSDGTDISIDKNPSEYTSVITTTTTTEQSRENGITYVLNTNSKKIHYADCSSVKKMKDKNKGYTDDYTWAISQGYEPCGNCNPR